MSRYTRAQTRATKKILSHRTQGGRLEFEIEWQGGAAASWVDIENIHSGNRHLQAYLGQFLVGGAAGAAAAPRAPAGAPAEPQEVAVVSPAGAGRGQPAAAEDGPTEAEWFEAYQQEHGEVTADQIPQLLVQFKAAHQNVAPPAPVPDLALAGGMAGAGLPGGGPPNEAFDALMARLGDGPGDNDFADVVDKGPLRPAGDLIEQFCKLISLEKTPDEMNNPQLHSRNMQYLLAAAASKESDKKDGASDDKDDKRLLRLKNHMKLAMMEEKSRFMPIAADYDLWAERMLKRGLVVTDLELRTALADHQRIMLEIKSSEGWMLALQYEECLAQIVRDAGHLKFSLLEAAALQKARQQIAAAKRRRNNQ